MIGHACIVLPSCVSNRLLFSVAARMCPLAVMLSKACWFTASFLKAHYIICHVHAFTWGEAQKDLNWEQGNHSHTFRGTLTCMTFSDSFVSIYKMET